MKTNFKINWSRIFGKFLFLLMYVLIGIQVYVIYYIEEDRKNTEKSWLIYWKIFGFILSFISIFCHLQASFTDPGMINHKNNLKYMDFYISTRLVAVKRAETYNKLAKGLIRPPHTDSDDEDERDLDFSDCEYDSNQYDESPLFTQEKLDKMNKEYGYEFSICRKCKICKLPGTLHCSSCEGCIYTKDHHCPWLNNCVGQFNHKFFLQFCIYSFLASLVFTSTSIYYVAIKRPLLLTEELRFGILIIMQMVISLCSVVLFIRLLYDQYDNFKDMMTQYHFKKNKMIEKRTFLEVVFEIFGGLPSIWWYIPFKVGGLYSKFQKIKLS